MNRYHVPFCNTKRSLEAFIFTILILLTSLARAGEADVIASEPKLFQRTGKQLTLKFSNKRKKVLKDSAESATDGYLKSEVVEYVKVHKAAVIKQDFYEGGQFLLVSMKSGHEVVLPTAPLWSPKQSAFISTNDDESDYTTNEAVIGVCKNQKCTKNYNRKGRTGEPKWLSENEVQFELREYDNGTGTLVSKKTVNCEVKTKVTCNEK